MTFTRISLHCMLVPVQNREYETGLFQLSVRIPGGMGGGGGGEGVVEFTYLSEASYPSREQLKPTTGTMPLAPKQ